MLRHIETSEGLDDNVSESYCGDVTDDMGGWGGNSGGAECFGYGMY